MLPKAGQLLWEARRAPAGSAVSARSGSHLQKLRFLWLWFCLSFCPGVPQELSAHWPLSSDTWFSDRLESLGIETESGS